MNLPEPPPFPPPQWQPPAPPVPPPPSAIPAGYVPYSTTDAGKPARGASRPMIVLFWCVTAANAIGALATYHRKSVIHDVLAGGGIISGADVDADERARQLIVASVGLILALTVAAAILTSLWSRRVAMNATARGARDVRVGMAGGGWFIPFGWWWLGFKQLRHSVEGVGRSAPSLQRWQALWIGTSMFGWFTRNVGTEQGTLREFESSLNSRFLLALVATALYAGCTVFASRAAAEVNDAVSPP